MENKKNVRTKTMGNDDKLFGKRSSKKTKSSSSYLLRSINGRYCAQQYYDRPPFVVFTN